MQCKGVGLALHLLLRFVIESLNRLVSIIKLQIEKHKKNLSGGGSCAHENNIGMHRMSAA